MTNNSKEFNQQTMRAVILIILVVLLYSNLVLAPKKQNRTAPVPPQQQQVAQQVTRENVVAPASPQPTGPVTVVNAPPPPALRHPSGDELQAAGLNFVQSDLIRVAISNLGARVKSYALLNYKVSQADQASLDLIGDLHDAPYPLGVYVGSESDENVRYTLVAVNGSRPESSPTNLQIARDAVVTLDFEGALPSGTPIKKSITLRNDSYLLEVNVTLGAAAPAGQVIWLEWTKRVVLHPSERTPSPHATYLDGADKIHHVPAQELSPVLRDFGTTRWIAVGDLYFMSTLIPTVLGRNTMISLDKDLYASRVAGNDRGGSFKVYSGPKDYKTLEFVGDYQLQRSIDLGFFSFLALPLLWLLHYLYLIFNNYGLAIIALTLIIKTALLPLSKASFKSMKAMQEIQPEMKALRERVKDPTQLNQEIMALYKRRGVNPMGGCLPIMLQIPVFFGLYQALLNSIELRHSPFALWITDLSSPEKLEVLGIGIPVMVLLMAASMIIQQWTTPNPSADPTQQKMMMIMPIVFAGMFIIFPMPAGLVLYWLVNNIISITQQMYLRDSKGGSVYWATFVASAAIFGFGFILTLV